MRPLPVLGDRAAETSLCTYCPKLCRPACAVSTVEGRETVTPWGKMRAMGEVIRAVAPVDAAHLAPAFACTGCQRCFELCDLDNPVAETLRDGRAEAHRTRTSPTVVRDLVATFERREAALAKTSSQWSGGGRSVAYFPGCTRVHGRSEQVAGIARAVETLAGPTTVVADACCGLPLLEAGDVEGFRLRAKRLAEKLARFDRVVTDDAGCAHAMLRAYPTHDVKLPPVEHLAQTAARAIGKIPALATPPTDVVYHDPCRLGRGLGVYDEPRAVLTKLLGRAPGELAEHRAHAPCSGGGGLLPKSRPATARAIAHELHALGDEVGARTWVTGCPTSTRMLERDGAQVIELAVLVATALG